MTFQDLQIVIHVISGTITSYQNQFINSPNKRLHYSLKLEILCKQGIVIRYINDEQILTVNASHPEIKKLYANYR